MHLMNLMRASTMIGKQKCRIKNAQLHGGEGKNHPFMSGLILRHDKRWVVLQLKIIIAL